MHSLKAKYGVSELCRYLCCSRSGYYDWIRRGKPSFNKYDEQKAAMILQVYLERKTRGRRQVQMQLQRHYGVHMSLGSVHRYMGILNIRSIRTRKYISAKRETQTLIHTFPNALQQEFCVSSDNPAWVTDVTYLPSRDGMLYLSCIKDLRDKSIIAYHISIKNDLALVMQTLNKAVATRRMRQGILLHSDQGSQYCSPLYHRFLGEHGLIGSMSRKAMPYDNAPMESFFSILKNEELKLYRNLTMQQMKDRIARFIQYYNHERPQYGLKKLTPVEYRDQFS